MKKIIMMILLVGVLAAAGCGRSDSIGGIRKVFPNSDLFPIPDDKWSYVVTTESNEIYFVKNWGGDFARNYKTKEDLTLCIKISKELK